MSDKPKELQALPETSPEVLSAMQELTRAAAEDVPKLPEHLFIQHLLPLLRDTSGEVDLSIWLDIAGQANRPIDVIGPAGDLLFRLPPILQSLPTRPHRGRSYADIIGMAKLKTDVHPRLGGTYLERALQDEKPVEVPQTSESRETLKTILARYDGSTPKTGTPLSSSVPSTGSSVTPALSDEEDAL